MKKKISASQKAYSTNLFFVLIRGSEMTPTYKQTLYPSEEIIKNSVALRSPPFICFVYNKKN